MEAPKVVYVDTDGLGNAVKVHNVSFGEESESIKYIRADLVESNAVIEQEKNKARCDCTTCKYGKYNDHWDMSFCYNPEKCDNFELYEKK